MRELPAANNAVVRTNQRKTGAPSPIVLNDVHTRLNPTRVQAVVSPRSVEKIVAAVHRARRDDLPLSICGGRHAMGGQQFVEGGLQVDLTRFNSVVDFRPQRRLVTVQAGIEWPDLLMALQELQPAAAAPLTFRQKQTGADRLSIGGALAANVHGRGLRLKPFVDDVESFTLVGADGRLRRCSRAENAGLFALTIGGYGLFGVVCEVTLRIVPRHKLRRVVEITTLAEFATTHERRIAAGYEYGDFQFSIDPADPGFLDRGVLSAYLPESDNVDVTADAVQLGPEQWQHLLALAHTDKGRAFDQYADHYRATHGQVYWSDLHQLGVYVDGYHERIGGSASEMITEIFVPAGRLLDFMAACRDDFRRHEVELIYGTIRTVRGEGETFLPWARQDRACVVFNLHVQHDPAGIATAQRDFRRIIDRALQHDGSFYLTYHRWATPGQLVAGHPRFLDFLHAKLAIDPDERFQSQWYRHWRALIQVQPRHRATS
jgi:FAD/FMN-containing dehydrogenase